MEEEMSMPRHGAAESASEVRVEPNAPNSWRDVYTDVGTLCSILGFVASVVAAVAAIIAARRNWQRALVPSALHKLSAAKTRLQQALTGKNGQRVRLEASRLTAVADGCLDIRDPETRRLAAEVKALAQSVSDRTEANYSDDEAYRLVNCVAKLIEVIRLHREKREWTT